MIQLLERRLSVFNHLKAGLFLLAGVVPLLSCTDGMTGPSDLVGGVWRLESMQLAGASAFVPDDPSRFTLEFQPDGRIAVVAECNRCGGSYTLSGATLTVPAMACTLAACATSRGEEFAVLVQGSSTLATPGDGRLAIASAEGTLLMRR